MADALDLLKTRFSYKPADLMPDDGPTEADKTQRWMDFTGKSDLLMYGSSYPHWSTSPFSSVVALCIAALLAAAATASARPAGPGVPR